MIFSRSIARWTPALCLAAAAGVAAQSPVYTGPSTRRGSIVLSEIMYHPAGDVTPGSREFIELYNSSPISEDLSGWKLRGDVDYTLPAGTRLAGGQFLLIAADPAALQASGVTGTILGPWTGSLPNSSGTVRLRKASGGIALETTYADDGKWPAAPDGYGHSLVLARPSYGESRVEAWSASALPGGSPGAADARTLTPEPAAALDRIIVSEILTSSPPGSGFVEFYNPAATAADLSGCRITADRTLPGYTIPAATTLAPGAYLSIPESTLGFSLDPSGGDVVLRAADGLRVLTAKRYNGQDAGLAWGPVPLTSTDWRELTTPTPSAVNAAALERPVVINEIHYHPAGDDDTAEYVELHNRGATAADISGWRFADAISYTFPAATSIPAGGFLVVAKDAAALLASHPGLNAALVLGPFSGTLGNGGERLSLTLPRSGTVPSPTGPAAGNWRVVADEVTWVDGGRWPALADGGGTSLQLRDPRSDNSLAPSWFAADESGKASTITVEHTGVLDLGHPKTPEGATRFFFMMNGEGEAFVDDVQVLVGGQNRVANGDFANGLTGWKLFGTHRPTVAEAGGMHVSATDEGDLANLIEAPLTSTIPPGTTVTLRAKVRWISGHPEVLLGLNGGWLEAPGTLPVPTNAGTPGAANTGAGNTGPAITDVSHSPLLPQTGEVITVTARISDPDNVAAARVRYRLDPAASLQQVTMNDSGTAGDERAGDGIFTGRIPAQNSGTMLAWHILTADGASPSVTSTFPADATNRECLTRIGETTPAGNLGTYRLWITRASHDTWRDRERSSNLDLDATFVADGRVIYNCGTHYAGSQNGVTIYDSPTGNPAGYNISLPPDEVYLNTQKLTLDRETTRDVTRQREQLMFWFLDKLGLPNLHRRYVHLYLNGVKRDQFIMEDVQKPNSDSMAEWFDDTGRLTKTNPWFEFDPNGNVQLDSSLGPRLQPFTTTGGALKLPRYRRTWSHAAGHDSAHDFSGISALITAAQAPAASFAATMSTRADLRQWMRTFAMNDLAAFWDTFGNPGAKNAYLFESLDSGRWSVFTWDMDVGLGVFNDPVDSALFPSNVDPAIIRLYNEPSVVRDYWQALDESLATFFVSGTGTEVDRRLQERYDTLIANGAAVTSPFAPSGPYSLSVTEWITQRRAFLQGQLSGKNAAFAASGPATSASVFATVTGTAPLATHTIEANGIPLTLTWSSITQWSASVVLSPGANALTLTGKSAEGVPTGTGTVNIQFTGSANWPALRINEWMASNPPASGITDPADGKAEDWLELLNPSAAAVPLEGWYLSDDPANPLLFRIPAGFSLPASGYGLVWCDDETAQNNPAVRQDIHAPFKLSASGETLILSAPDGTEVDRVTFAAQTSGIARQRTPDGGAAFGYTGTPTPGSANPAPVPAAPPADLAASLTDGVLTISFTAAAGGIYETETSPDLETWTPAGSPLAPAAGSQTFTLPASPEGRLFLRIRSY